MKVLAAFLAFLIVSCTGQTTGISLVDPSVTPTAVSTAPIPRVKLIPRLIGARLKNLDSYKLIVTGENFDGGATIYTGDTADGSLKTRNDPDSRSTTLIAKKGGKLLPFNEYFGLIVRNANGNPSFPLEYIRSESFWALSLPYALYPFPVNLQVGDYLVVRYLGRATDWGVDPSIFTRVYDLTLPSDEDFAFQAVRAGTTGFYAEIAIPGGPPPLVLYNNGIIVE